MKLVNPTGKIISTFRTEANRCSCWCSVVPGSPSQHDSAAGGASNTYCSCSCSYGSANRDANLSNSYNA